MHISNDRNYSDSAYLHTQCWSGMFQGRDGYPTKVKDFDGG